MTLVITNLILLILLATPSSSSSKSESEILVKFKDSLGGANAALPHWNTLKPPCSGDNQNWGGVLCKNGTVWGLKLENRGLKGSIDVDSLKDLPYLRTLSFINNSLNGPLPKFNKLVEIKSVYLTHNRFSGEIPAEAFDGMLSLKKLHLGSNGFSGPIPMSITVLPMLTELSLEHNQFEGELPDFAQERLQLLNVSNNNLAGPIPSRLSFFSATSFSGNKDLCGKPLQPCCSYSKLSVTTIVVNGIVVLAAIAAIAAATFILLRKGRDITTQPEDQTCSVRSAKMGQADVDHSSSSSSSSSSHGKKNSSSTYDNQIGKLSFLRDDRERLDLPDLLKASAEILGSGVFGSTYKATLNNIGSVMVVKRFRYMNNVGKEEFQEHMRRLGKLRHSNLLPLVAFYYRKQEKLLVSDYIDNLSLAAHLHGGGQASLDWTMRLRIVKGVAKGLLYLYNELPSLIAPHGHLKSSNVLVRKSFEPLIGDYGLVPIINQENAQALMMAYKSPEYKQNGRITKKTDVWSLGILILEILTGIFPENSLTQGQGSDTDLATWVQSVVREDRAVHVFDKEMGGIQNCESEMLMLLNIGLNCCETDVDKRWDIKEVVGRIEEL